MGRKVVGLIIGFLCGGLVVALVEAISSLLYPIPDNLDPNNIDDLKTVIASLPVAAFVFVLLAHFLGSMSAGFTLGLYVNKHWTVGAFILGAIFTLAGISNLILIPHPSWFAVLDTLIYIPAAYLGSRVAGLFKPTTPSELQEF